MVITNDFIFVHLEKCGGNSMRQFLPKLYPRCKIVNTRYKHLTIRRLHECKWLDPKTMVYEKYYKLPCIGNTRNPWAWYVSLYFDDKRNNGKYWKELSEGKSIGFKEFLNKLLDPPERLKNTKFPPNISHPPHRVPVLGISRENGIGVYTYYHVFAYIIKGEDMLRNKCVDVSKLDVKLHKLEKQPSALYDFLAYRNIKKPKVQYPVVNPSGHADYKKYYDEPTKKIVSQADEVLIKKFGYTFNG